MTIVNGIVDNKISMNEEKLRLLGFEKGLSWTYGKSDCYVSTDKRLETIVIEYRNRNGLWSKLILNRDFDTVENLLECFKKFESFYYEYIYED